MSVRKNFGVTNNNPIDAHVGRRLKICRTQAGMTQEELGALLGITFQQVQKYERATNRISASRLWDLAQSLGVPVGYFFDDMDARTAAASPARSVGLKAHAAQLDPNPIEQLETLDLTTAYYKIPDPKVRRSITEMLRAVATLAD